MSLSTDASGASSWRAGDAADVAISTAFGQPVLKLSEVTTCEERIAA
jgi:hypothetical protein